MLTEGILLRMTQEYIDWYIKELPLSGGVPTVDTWFIIVKVYPDKGYVEAQDLDRYLIIPGLDFHFAENMHKAAMDYFK